MQPCRVLLRPVGGRAELVFSTFRDCIPKSLKERHVGIKQLRVPFLIPEPEDCLISVAFLLCCSVGLAAAIVYVMTRHFLANNGLGIAFSLEVRCAMHCRAARGL